MLKKLKKLLPDVMDEDMKLNVGFTNSNGH